MKKLFVVSILFSLSGYLHPIAKTGIIESAKPLVVSSAEPWMGVLIKDSVRGVVIQQVFDDTPAAKADMQQRDIIFAINRHRIRGVRDTIRTIQSYGVGTSIEVTLFRGNRKITKTLKLVNKPEDTAMWQSNVKKTLPALSLATINFPATIQLDQLKGKIVLVQFWATWCPHCRSSHKVLSRLAEKYPERLVVLAVSKESSRTLRQYALQNSFRFIIVRDAKGELFSKMMVPALPAMLVIDKQGVIQHAALGGGYYFKQALNATLDLLKQ